MLPLGLLTRIVCGMLACFALFAVYNLHYVTTRDPTSVFFNPRLGYTPHYSATRTQEAEAFIASTNGSAHIYAKAKNGSKKLCVGIPSMVREDAGYLRTAVGSLLEGLTPEERSEIYLIVFISHSDPTTHPAYAEQWLPDLANEVLEYEVEPAQMDYIRDMERENELHHEKALYDYSYLLKACYDKEIPYLAIVADDVVAMDGWYHRSLHGIQQAMTLSALKKDSTDFFYLRLFYTEEFFRWHSENWQTYLWMSMLALALPLATLVGLRSQSASAHHLLSNRVVVGMSVCMIVLIALFFALGHNTVLPIPEGINYMPKHGCCSQGLLFPREKAISLVHFFEERKKGSVNTLIEEYADEKEEMRWAITPSVIQHVHRKSSKAEEDEAMSKSGMEDAEKIWSFGFEELNAKRLKEEHKMVAKYRHGT